METKTSTARVALKYGLIGAVVLIVYSTILNVSGLTQNKALSSLSFVILIVAMVLGMKDFREDNGGFMSYGQGLGIGSLMGAIMGLIGSAFTMFYIEFIDNAIITQTLDNARADMEARGMDDSQIDQAMEMSAKFMSPGMMFVIGVFSYLIIGFIISLIVSAIMRKDKPVFE